MAKVTTIGRLIVNEALPESFRDDERVLDKKGLAELLKRVAVDTPDRYREVSKSLADLGRRVAQRTGGYSFPIAAMRRNAAGQKYRDQMRRTLHDILSDDSLDDAKRNKAIVDAAKAIQEKMVNEVYDEAIKTGNPLAQQVFSGAKGSKGNLASLLAGDLLYEDARGRPIPIPVLESFNEGLMPASYWASTYGARRGVIGTKLMTANAGYYGKLLNQVAHRKVVVADDAPEPEEGEDRPLLGLPVEVDDKDNEGSLLAREAAGYPRNTLLTPKVLRDLKQQGVSKIVVRSPIASGSPDGGVYAYDVGVRDGSRLPGIGSLVGMESAQAIAEPVSQGSLNCLAAGTLVRMADWTTRPIEAVEPGELVMGSDEAGNLRPVRVVRRFDNGARLCYRTAFAVAGTKERVTLESTLDHKVAGVARLWDPKTELAVPGIYPVGHKCVKLLGRMAASVVNPHGRAESFALLFGLLLGDGCYTEAVNSVNFSCHDPSLIEDIQPLLAPLNLRASRLKGHKGYYTIAMVEDVERDRDSVTGRMVSMGGAVNPIRRELVRRGMYGKYAHEKTIPEDVWEWDQQSVASLIGGFFATDGSVCGVTADGEWYRNVYVTFGSTSVAMLETLRQLLAVRFGIYASRPSRTGRAGQGNRKHDMWAIAVNRRYEVLKFRESIPLYGVKRRTFDRLLGQWRPRRDANLSFFYRKTQTKLGLRRTYDIEVDHPSHLFQLANGLIVSNSKHQGGVAGASKTLTGFDALNALANVPKVFPHGASLAEADGKVQRIVPAEHGGNYVYVADKEHYVPPGLEVTVKPGEDVEAGDVLSEGEPNPAEIAQHKGLGEGRRYWVKAMLRAMQGAGTRANRRNLELVASGLINHVKLHDEIDGWAPDDVVPYHLIASRWQPRKDALKVAPDRAAGMYLEQPVLHYSIGTKLRPSVIKELKEFGVKDVRAHRQPPPFDPVMIRAADSLQYDEDWMTRMYGSGLKGSIQDAVHTGNAIADETGTSFVPGLARSSGFGTYGKIRTPTLGTPAAALPSTPTLRAPQFVTGKAAGDVNATPNRNVTNTAPAGGGSGGGGAVAATPAGAALKAPTTPRISEAPDPTSYGYRPAFASPAPATAAGVDQSYQRYYEGVRNDPGYSHYGPGFTGAAGAMGGWPVAPQPSPWDGQGETPTRPQGPLPGMAAEAPAPPEPEQPQPQQPSGWKAMALPATGMVGQMAIGQHAANLAQGQWRPPLLQPQMTPGSLARGTAFGTVASGTLDAAMQLATTGQVDPRQVAQTSAEGGISTLLGSTLRKAVGGGLKGNLITAPLISTGMDLGKNLLGMTTDAERRQSLNTKARLLTALNDDQLDVGTRLAAGGLSALQALMPNPISDTRALSAELKDFDTYRERLAASNASLRAGTTGMTDQMAQQAAAAPQDADLAERARQTRLLGLRAQARSELSDIVANASHTKRFLRSVANVASPAISTMTGAQVAAGMPQQPSDSQVEKGLEAALLRRAEIRHQLQSEQDLSGNGLTDDYRRQLNNDLMDVNKAVKEMTAQYQ